MEKEHTNQEPEHEDLLGEAPPISVPDVSEYTDEEGIDNDMPVHQNGEDEIEEGDATVHDAGSDEDRLSIPDELPVLPLKDTVIYPFAVQPLAVAFESVDARLLDAAAVLGAGRWRTFREIILPLSIRGVITAAVLSFAHTLGEFGVVLMVGGNIPGITRTISIDIYDHVQSLDYDAANRMAVALLLISFAVLASIYAVNRRVWSLWPVK